MQWIYQIQKLITAKYKNQNGKVLLQIYKGCRLALTKYEELIVRKMSDWTA